MRIHLIAVGTRMPSWVEEGYREYAKRMPPECQLHLTEVPLAKRTKNSDPDRLRKQEGEKVAASVPKGAHIVALEVNGRPWSTGKLSQRLDAWLGGGQDVALLVGGPDGLSPACRDMAREWWSLSPLTLPHPLVRIIVAEQIYRAWTLLKGHPYHR